MYLTAPTASGARQCQLKSPNILLDSVLEHPPHSHDFVSCEKNDEEFEETFLKKPGREYIELDKKLL